MTVSVSAVVDGDELVFRVPVALVRHLESEHDSLRGTRYRVGLYASDFESSWIEVDQKTYEALRQYMERGRGEP